MSSSTLRPAAVASVPGGSAEAFGISGARLGRRWLRGLLGALGGVALGVGLVFALRAVSGLPLLQTEQTGYPHMIVPAITAPLGFLLGFGAFDYWLRWALGRRPSPRTTPTTAPPPGATTSTSTPTTR